MKSRLRNLQVGLNSSIECAKEKLYNKIASKSVEAIGKIIQNHDSNKAHGHDNTSIRILNICGDSIYNPLEIIFRQALLTGVFPPKWRKGNSVSVHKKVTSKILKIIVRFLCFRFTVTSLKD